MAEPRPDVGTTSLTLLDRARANEADAWARLVLLYAPLVRHWCLAGGLQPTDVDDVVQEVCRVAFSGLAGFRRDRPGDTFRGWLRTITRTALALHYRKLARVPVAGGGSAAFARLQEVADPAPDLPDDDPSDEVRGLHRRALEHGPRRVRGSHLADVLAHRRRGPPAGRRRRPVRGHPRGRPQGQVARPATAP